MKDIVNKITDSTLIPIGSIIVLAGGMFWLSMVYWNGTATAKGVEEVKTEQTKQKDEYNKTINEINSRMARMEQSLKNIEERL